MFRVIIYGRTRVLGANNFTTVWATYGFFGDTLATMLTKNGAFFCLQITSYGLFGFFGSCTAMRTKHIVFI